MIQLTNLVKRFEGVTAVDRLSFVAPDGAITGLLGANGAGKTTTLGIIAGTLAPDAGSVTFGPPSGPCGRLRRDQVGALLDQRGLYARLTVRENVAYFARLQGLTGRAERAAVDEIIGLLGLEALVNRSAAGLSEGERMRVALARAMVHGPPNLLLDEPTNGLDVSAVRSLRELLRRMRSRGLCLLFSSHVLDDVRQLCDRVVVIARGRLVAEGSTGDICRLAGTTSFEDAFIELASGKEARA